MDKIEKDVIIIGGGLAGISAARQLRMRGYDCAILEASDRLGGRLKTDVHEEGFRLDRGFQILLDAYPECRAELDYEALNLKKFLPGALIHDYDKEKIYTIGDPFRQINSLIPTLTAPTGRFTDKIRMLLVKTIIEGKDIGEIFEQQPELNTYQALRKDYKFDKKIINFFFKPFFSGIFLENDLSSSRRMFDFVFKMLSKGNATLPALGIEEIPKQLAAFLPPAWIHTQNAATSIRGNTVSTKNKQKFVGKRILIATEPNSFLEKYYPKAPQKGNGTFCFYFATREVPFATANIGLLPSSRSLITNFTVLSNISADYAPQGQHLIAVSINDDTKGSKDTKKMIAAIKTDLGRWYNTKEWRWIKTYHIPYALPIQKTVRNTYDPLYKVSDKIFLAGDYLLHGSIEGAMRSGRLAAEAIVQSGL
ncbi:MAG: FAD-dependent oxidoreductase [Bernardetiaceae bacterium]|nr:FAD-dependent oxidoreductase [Bernardetiaceae bacterium]